MSRSRDYFILASHLLIGVSFPIRVLGDILRTNSSQHGQWLASFHLQYDDLPGAGLALLYFNPLTVVFGLVSTILTVCFIQLLLTLAKQQDAASRLLSIVLSLFLLFLIVPTLNSVQSSLSWQFYTLAVGQLAFLSGLYCGLSGYVCTVWK